jgi:hypothetical protein
LTQPRIRDGKINRPVVETVDDESIQMASLSILQIEDVDCSERPALPPIEFVGWRVDQPSPIGDLIFAAGTDIPAALRRRIASR